VTEDRSDQGPKWTPTICGTVSLSMMSFYLLETSREIQHYQLTPISMIENYRPTPGIIPYLRITVISPHIHRVQKKVVYFVFEVTSQLQARFSYNFQLPLLSN